ncbi:MAG: hypothetical protein HYX65_06535 [Gemmatimonadetes bacterium]|nr:hypothetical protein [Gemmatimonadota bacterium]
MPPTRTYSSLVPVAFAACAAHGWSTAAQGQGASGGLNISVTVQDPVKPIALLHSVAPAQVRTSAAGAYASLSLGVALETPFTVRVRTVGGDSARGPAARVRLHGGAQAALGTGMVTLAQVLPAGSHDLAIEFAAADGEASQLDLPATEVTITAIDGDAVTEATATYAAASLPLPVVARPAATPPAAPVPATSLAGTRGRGRQ